MIGGSAALPESGHDLWRRDVARFCRTSLLGAVT